MAKFILRAECKEWYKNIALLAVNIQYNVKLEWTCKGVPTIPYTYLNNIR